MGFVIGVKIEVISTDETGALLAAYVNDSPEPMLFQSLAAMRAKKLTRRRAS